MKEISNIKVKVESGKKYTTDHGFHAVKDGIRNKKENSVHIRKPEWLKVKKQDSKEYLKVKSITKKNRLSTVCEEAKCPNI
ncbi:lipoyl synthase, partial [Francisella orientalis]|nr:lipoyl synthase [Francisella orientalis]MBK2007458.1 lipoyl synthase [Francisella orientalis]